MHRIRIIGARFLVSSEIRRHPRIPRKAAIAMLQEIRIPRGSKFRVQREFRRKYSEYECYIASGSDIDLVADTDGDLVP